MNIFRDEHVLGRTYFGMNIFSNKDILGQTYIGQTHFGMNIFGTNAFLDEYESNIKCKPKLSECR